MQFESILYETFVPSASSRAVPPPACLNDLHLDQVFAGMVRGREVYDLAPFFYELPQRIETALYRQGVMQDVAQRGVRDAVKSFSEKMQSLREQLTRTKKLFYQRQKERVFLDAVAFYCDATIAFKAALSKEAVKSQGLLAFRDFIAAYIASDRFTTLRKEISEIKSQLSDIEYQLLLRDNRIIVSDHGEKSDYSADIERSFRRFRRRPPSEYAFKSREYSEMNHIEAGILDLVAKLFPDAFSRLARFHATHQSFLDPIIARWDREIQFYLCYLDYIEPLAKHGLQFCYPSLSATSKGVRAQHAFDLALAHKLAAENDSVVTNDFHLQGSERIFVVTGPNQGGKTTFARMFGQMHYLARLGYPVPGLNAQLFFFDRLLTHFEREEDISTHRGKLEDELIRSREIIREATPQSIVILNEVFTSTTLEDALFLARRLLETLIDLDLLCVCVTFMDELSRLAPSTVSLVSCMAIENPSQRTFRVVRQMADGKSYAASIAERYGLSYKILKERLLS